MMPSRGLHWFALMLLPVLSAAASSPAQSPAGQATSQAAIAPAAALSPQDRQLVADIQAQLRRQAERLRNGSIRERQMAQQEILALQRAVLGPILGQIDTSKEPLDDAVLDALAEMRVDVTFSEMIAPLAPKDQEQLRQWRLDHPDVVRRLCGSHGQDVFRELYRNDPQHRTEPLLIAMLKSGRREQAQTVFLSLMTGDGYASDEMVAMLGEFALGARGEAADPTVACQAMTKLSNPRVAPFLLARMVTPPESSENITFGIETKMYAAALLAHDPEGAMRTVMRELKPTPIIRQLPVANSDLTIAWCDSLVYAACVLSKQAPGDYNLFIWPRPEIPTLMGFSNDEVRQAAIKKLQAWWEDNKDKPPYKDHKALTPATVPSKQPTDDSNRKAQP